MLKEIKPLYDLGVSIIWLKEGSKAPLSAGWTKAPAMDWEKIKSSYRAGFNVGARPGVHSELSDGTYLAIIDCDVKSSDEKHLKQMQEALSKLVPGRAPFVESGRGNGSKHVYCKSDNPVNGFTFAQSEELTKVKINSKPSKRDIAKLTKQEIDAGYRIRSAWEISILGSGNQAVLPPSIHPDTGKAYFWGSPITDVSDLPVIDIKDKNPTKTIKNEDIPSFYIENVDLTRLDAHTISSLTDGEGVQDASAFMLRLSLKMLSLGYSVNQVVNVFCNRSYFIGETPYRHTASEDWERAAAWAYKYTIAKALEKMSAQSDFEALIVEGDEGGKELTADSKASWTGQLARTDKGNIRATFKNAVLILENSFDKLPFYYDEFKNEIRVSFTNDFGDKNGLITDSTILRVKYWFADNFKVELPTNTVHEVVDYLCDKNKRDSLQEHVLSLKWDGVDRIGTWLRDYCNAEGSEAYLSAVSEALLKGMVLRAFEPGYKFDLMVILEGEQGVGKSSIARILASEDYFLDTHLNIDNKDAIVQMQGAWVVEMGELVSLKRAAIETLKNFITVQSDKVRPPYGRRMVAMPRRSLFIGTTNEEAYLKDITGNRRFAPVKIGAPVDLAAFRAVRDQLIAEAYFKAIVCGDDSLMVVSSLEYRKEHAKLTNSKIYIEEELKSSIEELIDDGFFQDRDKVTKDVRDALLVMGIKPPKFSYIKNALIAKGLKESRSKTKRFWYMAMIPRG